MNRPSNRNGQKIPSPKLLKLIDEYVESKKSAVALARDPDAEFRWQVQTSSAPIFHKDPAVRDPDDAVKEAIGKLREVRMKAYKEKINGDEIEKAIRSRTIEERQKPGTLTLVA